MKSERKHYRRWFKKYIRAIHRHDQCQAMADEMVLQGNPRAANVRNLQRMYAFFAQIAADHINLHQNPSNEA